jgi:hypothetical protein
MISSAPYYNGFAINGSYTFKSAIGGLLSCVVYLILIAFVLDQMMIVVKRTKYDVSTYY